MKRYTPFIFGFLILVCIGFIIGLLLAQKDTAPISDVSNNEGQELSALDIESLMQPIEVADTELSADQPVHVFLFTHTEDHFNHALSEERYTRTGALLEDLQAKYPDQDLTWTIQFQGADAKTVTERNAVTGIVDYLKDLHTQGLVEFGYHAHHDPTYINRPQLSFSASSTWDEIYDGVYAWITCEKHPTEGGCIAENGGGLLAILETFGQVSVVSGVGTNEGVMVEHGPGSEAIRSLLPDRLLGFGFPDHGAATEMQNYEESMNELLRIMTPTQETSSGVLWMDNAVRINDGVPLDNTPSLTLRMGPEVTDSRLASLDRTRTNVINAGLVDKYFYTKTGTSPTKYGYAHPDSPELPDEWLLSDEEREKNYQMQARSMEYLLSEFMRENQTSSFVTADDVVNLYTSDDYWIIDEDELTNIAMWLLQEWDDMPPAYAYDGEDFYSLADAFGLLASDIANIPTIDAIELDLWHGPWAPDADTSEAVTVSYTELREFIEFELGSDTSYRIADSYTMGNASVSPAQALYALAASHLASIQGESWDVLTIPSTNPLPATHELLESMQCISCYDTAWSLKPARIQD